MKVSEFRRAVEDEFGEVQGRTLVNEFAIGEFGDRTAEQALDAGVAAGDVWVALCRATGVPRDRWHGRGLPAPQR